MMSKSEIQNALNKTVQRLTQIKKDPSQEKCPIDIVAFDCWEWPQGVGLYGLFKYHEQCKDPRLLTFLQNWYDRRIAAGLPARNVNTTAPLLTLAHLCEITGNAGHLKICAEWAGWIMRDLPRTGDGGFQHTVTGHLHEQQIWADTLYMTVLFLAKMGIMLRRQDYIEEAIHQFLVHIKYLFDRETGLWFHGWTFMGRHNFARARWARGNCWFTAGVVDFIEMVNPPESVKRFLMETLQAQVGGLAATQAPDGMWHTLLDDSDSYVETSAVAGFGYGILKGVRKGYLDEKYVQTGRRALAAVKANILPDGTVDKVSFGTPMGKDLDHYRKIPQCPMAYGQALAILLLGEALRLPDNTDFQIGVPK
jgi:unsaturated rhamnogalacturonyl hydrolase